jgi:hypothetical protein
VKRNDLYFSRQFRLVDDHHCIVLIIQPHGVIIHNIPALLFSHTFTPLFLFITAYYTLFCRCFQEDARFLVFFFADKKGNAAINIDRLGDK